VLECGRTGKKGPAECGKMAQIAKMIKVLQGLKAQEYVSRHPLIFNK
jgi:hypothetical protein